MILLFLLLLSFCFHWEDISNTRDSVSSDIQTPWISSKILRCALYFQLCSRCLDIPMNHCLLSLICYFKNFKISGRQKGYCNELLYIFCPRRARIQYIGLKFLGTSNRKVSFQYSELCFCNSIRNLSLMLIRQIF